MKSLASSMLLLLLMGALQSSAAFAPGGSLSPRSAATGPSSSLGMLPLPGPDDWNAVSSSMTQADLLPTGVFDSLRSGLQAVATEGGPPVMALAVALTDTVPLLPTQPVAVVAGALFGLKYGLPAVVVGQALATAFCMLVGRFGLKDSDFLNQGGDSGDETNGKNSKLRKVLAELTSGLNSGDPKTVFWTILLARQTPVLPFSLGNYFVGAATEAPLLPAIAGTVVGCLPLNLVYVGAGAGGMKAVDMVKENGLLAEGLEGFGVLVTLGLATIVAQTIMKVYADSADEETITNS